MYQIVRLISPLWQVALKNGWPQDWGLVECSNYKDAETKQTTLNGYNLHGHNINISYYIPGVRAINLYLKLLSEPVSHMFIFLFYTKKNVKYFSLYDVLKKTLMKPYYTEISISTFLEPIVVFIFIKLIWKMQLNWLNFLTLDVLSRSFNIICLFCTHFNLNIVLRV